MSLNGLQRFIWAGQGKEAQLSQASEEEQRTEDQQTSVIYAAGRSRSWFPSSGEYK